MMNDPKTPPTEPPLEQQMAWSEVVRTRFDDKCWHDYKRDPICRDDNGESLWQYRCVKCHYIVWSSRESIPMNEDGTPVVEDGPVHHMQEQPKPGGPNYCTHALAWPALQKMLERDLNFWGRCITPMFPWSIHGDPDYGFGCEPIIRDLKPWQIIKAIAEFLEAERELLTPGVKE